MAKAERAQVSRTLYDRDYYAWVQDQVHALNERQFDRLDIANLTEELESLGRSERRELESRLEVLLAHLLKWAWDSRKRSRSWKNTIGEQRERIELLLEDNPSLSAVMEEALSRAWRLARRTAGNEMGMDEKQWKASFPAQCPWTNGQVLSVEFLPELPNRIGVKRRQS